MVIKPENLYYRVHFEPCSETAKAATPLVFLHGLMGFAANWGKIWPHFFHERRVLVLDQRGHGKSEKPSGGYAPEDYAGDLSGLLQFLNWPKAHIIGHSMGGRVAMAFAEKFPHQAASLILEDSGAEARPDRETWIRELLGNIPVPFANREAMKTFFALHFQDDPLTGAFLQTNLENSGEGNLYWRFDPQTMVDTVRLGRCQDWSASFAKLRLPTLIIRGEKSAEFTAAEAERMQKSNANASLVTISGAGHYVHSERPTEFSSALESFLRKAER